jgi:glycosyltransferase involved in cell wall biosynthesis
MRVLHVISEMGSGGAETLVTGMVTAGDEYGWTSAVASGGGYRADTLSAAGVATFPVPVPRRSAAGMVRAAAAATVAVRRFRPDVVLAHNVSASVVARLTGLRPLVTVFHGVAAADYPDAARILRRTSRTVVTVAAATADRLRAAGLESPVVIENTVFPQRPSTSRADVRAALGVGEDTPVALCVARMETQKRHDVLLNAWARLDGDAQLWLAGDGSLRPVLAEQAAHLPGVRFLGTRSDVPDLVAAADVTVLTSDWEGMPVAVLESLAAGVPVVASDVDGVRAAVAGGGLVVPRRSPAATAAALRTLLYDRDARAAKAGQATVRDHHALMTSYDDVLRAARSRR